MKRSIDQISSQNQQPPHRARLLLAFSTAALMIGGCSSETGKDFKQAAIEAAQYAREHNNTKPSTLIHSCFGIPDIRPESAPNLLVKDGWIKGFNDVREDFGLSILEVDDRLNATAQATAEEMVARHEFEHLKRPYGAGRILDTIPEAMRGLEIIGKSRDVFSSEKMITAFQCFQESSIHVKTANYPKSTHIGVGIAHYDETTATPEHPVNSGVVVVHFSPEKTSPDNFGS